MQNILTRGQIGKRLHKDQLTVKLWIRLLKAVYPDDLPIVIPGDPYGRKGIPELLLTSFPGIPSKHTLRAVLSTEFVSIKETPHKLTPTP